MTVVTWSDFLNVLQNISSACTKPQKLTISNIIKWVLTLNWQMQGVNQVEVNWAKTWIAALSIRFTGESKADLLACVKFLSWVNGTIPYHEIDTERVCIVNKYYWWNNKCRAYPEPGEPAPVPVPPPGPPPIDPDVFQNIDYALNTLVRWGEFTGKNIADYIEANWDYWYAKLDTDYETGVALAALDYFTFLVNMSLATLDYNIGITGDAIGEVSKLEGKTIVEAILAVEGGGSTTTQAQIDKLYSFLEISYREEYDSISRTNDGLMDNLVKIEAQWVDAAGQWGGLTKQDMANVLLETYGIYIGVIENIETRLAHIEQEIGITTEQVSGDIKRPTAEELLPTETRIFASQAWVIEAIIKAAGILIEGTEATTQPLAAAINSILANVVDISDEWLERLKEKLGSVGGTYDLEADKAFQEIASIAKAAETVITELPSWWVQSLAISLQDYLTTGGSAPGPAGPQGPGGPPGPMGPIGPIGPASEEGEGIGFNIEAIDTGLKDRIAFGYAESDTLLTETITRIMRRAVLVGDYIDLEVKPITDFLTVDMQSTLTEIAEAFETPEALIAFLLDVPEGQENITFDLWQILVTQIMERGLE